MKKSQKMLGFFSLLFSFLLLGVFNAKATTTTIAGTNASEVEARLYVYQGDAWILGLTKDTDKDGVLEAKNVPVGWTKVEIKTEDQKAGQTVAVRLRMLDPEGRKIEKEADVKVYAKISGVKTYAQTVKSDKEGWIELIGVVPGVEYALEIDEDADVANLKKSDDKVRIKISAKIDDSDWFRAGYKKTDANKVLNVDGVLPGKYKFRYKEGDYPINKPFILSMKLRNSDGEDLSKATKVKLYAYPAGKKVFVGEIKTDKKGRVTLPGMMPNIKYQVSVKD